MNFAHSRNGRRVVAAAVISPTLFVAGAHLAWTASAAPTKASGTKITLRHSTVGKVLAGDARKFLYVHVTTSGKDVACTAVCQNIWPTAMTTGKPRAGSGVKAAQLGQTSAHQVTYDGHRLYYYSFSPQSPAGDGAMSFGGTWKLVNAKGGLK